MSIGEWIVGLAMGAAIAAPSVPGQGAPPERIAYGSASSQFGMLWLPQQPGKAPVIVLIHGGCWLHAYGLDLMEPLAVDLRGLGFAVWNIEYRRLGETGGGYPGTFADVGAAVDALRGLAARHPLDLGRVVAIGHSAGGHLALWAAARPRLPAASPLKTPDPLPLAGVVTLAGIDDLAAYHAQGPACGGAGTIDALVDAARHDRFADTSPAAMLPLGVPQLVVSGANDGIVPPAFGRAYAKAAAAAGDRVIELTVPGTDHFPLIDPGSAAWRKVREQLPALLSQ
ncbi:MAG TPA: alpha/beta hydrolase [Stellaceae bacterium]|nr:alpha/beta hydrolase [Stellaceae bacterium]